MVRRGHIHSIDSPVNSAQIQRSTIEADVPLSEMIEYAVILCLIGSFSSYTSTLRRITSGDGTYTMTYKNYQEMLPNVIESLKIRKLL